MQGSYRKVAIIGVGHVGEMAAFMLATHNLASEVAVVDRRLARSRAVANDLKTSIHRLGSTSAVTACNLRECADADVAVITAALPVRLGQSRNDMFANNVGLYKTLVPELEGASFTGTYLVVTNPVDLMTYAMADVYGIDPERVVGTGTVLDAMRLADILMDEQGSSGAQALCLGEHGENLVVDWSHTSADGLEIPCEKREDIRRATIDYAYEIVKGKGSTSFGIAQSIFEILKAIASDEADRILPVSKVLTGAYGVSGIAASVPSICGGMRVTPVGAEFFGEGVEERLVGVADQMRATYAEAMKAVNNQ